MSKTVKVQLYKSVIGSTKKVRDTVKGLGLRRLNQIVELKATKEVEGMVNKIPHLVKIID